MTPNEGYQRRLEEWEKKEKERLLATKETPYDPDDMKGRVPLGCTMIVIVVVIAIAYAIYHYLRHAT